MSGRVSGIEGVINDAAEQMMSSEHLIASGEKWFLHNTVQPADGQKVLFWAYGYAVQGVYLKDSSGRKGRDCDGPSFVSSYDSDSFVPARNVFWIARNERDEI